MQIASCKSGWQPLQTGRINDAIDDPDGVRTHAPAPWQGRHRLLSATAMKLASRPPKRQDSTRGPGHPCLPRCQRGITWAGKRQAASSMPAYPDLLTSSAVHHHLPECGSG